MGRSIFVQNGKILKEAPQEGTFKACITLPITPEMQICFFSNCLELYADVKEMCDDPSHQALFSALVIADVFEGLAKESGCLELFESFHKQIKEVESDGKKS